MDECTECLSSHHDSAAPGFLPECLKGVPGAERVLGGSQRAPGWEALGGLSNQACQPRGDDALLLCVRAHGLLPLLDLVSEER